jgi:hypothetical protein
LRRPNFVRVRSALVPTALDHVSRGDCPIDDDQLIQAAAAGLLPLRQGGELVWIIAPRSLTARHLANPDQSRPEWLRSFRLTSSERLQRFVARHTQGALARRATDELRDLRPLMSNAPQLHGAGLLATAAFVVVALGMLAVAPAAAINCVAAVLCAVFLAAAALRLLSVAFTGHLPPGPRRMGDQELPIYTIICPLYREATVVRNLVAAIRGLDYPGMLAQTPQA